MSPQIALHDPVFRDYFWIVLISLAIAGAVLGFLRFVLKKETASMFKTYWSWILIAGIGFIVVFLGRIPTIVGVTLLAIYAFKEFAHASGLYRDSWMTGAVYAGIVTVGIASLISPPRGHLRLTRVPVGDSGDVADAVEHLVRPPGRLAALDQRVLDLVDDVLGQAGLVELVARGTDPVADRCGAALAERLRRPRRTVARAARRGGGRFDRGRDRRGGGGPASGHDHDQQARAHVDQR